MVLGGNFVWIGYFRACLYGCDWGNMFLNILGTKFEVIRVSYSFYLIDSANNIALQPSKIYFIIV